MLGVVFTEFLNMVEEKFDLDTVDAIIDPAKIENDGAYTAVGSYSHRDIVSLVIALSQHANAPVDDLVHTFGHHLAGRFAKLYPQFFDGYTDPFEFLSTVDRHIHREVKKLYPNAQLPSIQTEQIDEHSLAVVYQSHRSFGKLAEGLIQGALDYYSCDATIETENLSPDDASNVRFIVRKKTA